jgi:endonuclease/exonuclease/phosphatase family metal-dependent hydrolase
MKTTNLISVFFTLIFLTAGCSNAKQAQVRVMTFNIWMGGGKSLSETVRVIEKSGADIVGVQESTRDNIVNNAAGIADSLGWYSFSQRASETIISRYPIVDTSAAGYGVKIQLDMKHFIWMFNVHLYYCPYQPYQLNGIEYCGAPILYASEEAEKSSWETRGKQVLEVIEDIKSVQNQGFPLFLTGDFNEPSYLDWTERATAAGLCKMPVEWTATKAFTEQAGLRDSFRALFPDETKNPGHTWTPIDENDLQDRIDFVFYGGSHTRPISSEIVGENGPKSDIKNDNYPSDHRAVVSQFVL